MLNTFVSTLPIFLLIVTGFILKRHLYGDESFWKTIESITYYIFFPSLLILHVGRADFASMGDSSKLVAVVVATTLFVGVAVFVLRSAFAITDDLFTSIFQGSTRYNSYVFLGLALSLYGEKGVAIAGVFMTYMIIVTNAMSVIVLNHFGSTSSKKTLRSVAVNLAKNPLIVGSLVGVAINLLGIKITGPIAGYMEYLGAASSPLSLLAVGAGLRLKFSREKLVAIFSSSALKLILMPAATYGIIVYFGFAGGMSAKIALLYACVPTAGNSYILARQMGGDADAMASIITATTLASSVTSLLFIGLV